MTADTGPPTSTTMRDVMRAMSGPAAARLAVRLMDRTFLASTSTGSFFDPAIC